MYTPSSFLIDKVATIQSFIQEYSFATIFSQKDNNPSATHLPFTLDVSRGEYGTLNSHMARANPLWKSWGENTQVLIVFTGPHAYISPAWYKDQATVPTWNYSAVHVYGRPRLLHKPETIRTMVEDLVRIYETKEGSFWDQSLMQSSMEIDLKAIVGFEIEIARVEAKFKFNQNRSNQDQKGVIEALSEAGCPFKAEVACFMRKLQQE